MTDTEVKMPPFVPDDFQSEFACPKCGKTFPSKIALQGHQNVHRTPKPCPECGKQYSTPGALGNHRKVEHGHIGPWAEKAAAKERSRAKDEDPEEVLKAVQAKKKGGNGTRGRPPKTRINTEWHADDIFQSVIESLWPGGAIPTRCILPLVQWREATREFLEKVQSE